MKTKEYTQQTGKIKTFHLEDEIADLVKIPISKPSTRPIRTKKGKRAIAALIDLEKNHNHSWYRELKERAKKDFNATALFYRGRAITFKEMFERADDVAKSLVQLGVSKGDEIPCCLANTPELVYILLGANKIGARVNLFGTHLDPLYLESILEGCTKKIAFISDDNYYSIKEVVQKINYAKIIVPSLADSLPDDPKKCPEYEPELDSYYHYDNLVPEYKATSDNIFSFGEFLQTGENYVDDIIDDSNLNTEFLITYTSGSTVTGHPSQLIHTNRSLITSGRFHDSELSGNPELKGLRGLAHIHSESNTDIITCISDNLMQSWSVALEPEYDKKKALDYVILNKPNYLNATTSFLIEMSKQYLVKHKFHTDGNGRKLDFLLAAFAVGESTSKGEEKFINKFLRISRAGSGVKIKGISMPFTTLSVGGGDCEHGGIYYSLWRSIFEKLNYLRLKNRTYGLMPEPFAQVSAFRKTESGEYEECDYNEYGVIGANSATTMVGYKSNPLKTLGLIFRDTNGRDWVSSNVIGYIDELGGVHVKGRINDDLLFSSGKVIPAFLLEEEISKDTKNVLSCTVSTYREDNQSYIIVNIEFQPDKKDGDLKIINSIYERCKKAFGTEMADELNYRIIDNEASFPLTGSGKRSKVRLNIMALDGVFEFNDGHIINIIDTQNSKGTTKIKKML